MTTQPCTARQQTEVQRMMKRPQSDPSRGQQGGVSFSASALGGLCGAPSRAPCRRRCQPGRPLYRPQWRGRGRRGCLGGSEPLPPADASPRPCVAASAVCWMCLPTVQVLPSLVATHGLDQPGHHISRNVRCRLQVFEVLPILVYRNSKSPVGGSQLSTAGGAAWNHSAS